MPDNTNNISRQQIEAMIRMASGKLNMTPEQLKSVLSDHEKTDDLLNRIGGKAVFDSAMKDPKSIEKLIRNNPQAKKIIADLMRGQNNG